MDIAHSIYSRWRVGIFLGCLGLLVLGTANDYGSSWDEEIRRNQGERKLEYYRSILSADWNRVRELGAQQDRYPGFHDLNLALLRRVSPLSDIHTGHLFSALFGFLGIIGAWALGSRLGGPAVGFWSAGLLALFPVWYGHMFINPKDIPFACGYIWSLYAIVRFLENPAAAQWRLVIVTGLAIGVTMAVRVGGLVLLCYLGLFWGLLALHARWREPAVLMTWVRDRILPGLGRIAAIAVAAFVVLLVYWPAAHGNPVAHTGGALAAVTHFDWPMPVLFEGVYRAAADLPGYYILKVFWLKTPELILILWAIGLVWSVLWTVGKLREREWGIETHHSGIVLVIFAVCFPIYYVIVRESTLYNGLRHLLFVVPPSVVLAGLVLERLRLAVGERRPGMRILVPVFAGLLMLPTLIGMIRLHPYQYVQYNVFAGGVSGAAGHYEVDYWGTAYREAVALLVDYLDGLPPEEQEGRTFTVNMEHPTWLARHYLPEGRPYRIHLVRSQGEEANFYLASTTWEADCYYHGEVVGTVERMGVTLAVVKDRRGLEPEERRMYYGWE